jgi:hypothetical protein
VLEGEAERAVSISIRSFCVAGIEYVSTLFVCWYVCGYLAALCSYSDELCYCGGS